MVPLCPSFLLDFWFLPSSVVASPRRRFFFALSAGVTLSSGLPPFLEPTSSSSSLLHFFFGPGEGEGGSAPSSFSPGPGAKRDEAPARRVGVGTGPTFQCLPPQRSHSLSEYILKKPFIHLDDHALNRSSGAERVPLRHVPTNDDVQG